MFGNRCEMVRLGCRLLLTVSSVAWATQSRMVDAQTVWSGFTKSFNKPPDVDGYSSENQDKLTTNVIFARDLSYGLFNVAAEGSYEQSTSPRDTAWATALMPENDDLEIDATNWGALTFTDWVESFGGPGGLNGPAGIALPTALTTYNAVVHLLTDDVYLDIQFTDWGTGDGRFSYDRAEPPPSTTTGDYNGDGTVNAADYTLWRNTLGQSVDPAGGGADGIPNGLIDDADYDFWKQHFGETVMGSASGQASAVPEPAAALLMFVGLLTVIISRKFSPRGPGQG
jgi:hypothetical protein